MTDTGVEAAAGTPRYPRRPGRVALWVLGAIAPVLCLVVAVPGIAVTYLLAYPLLYAGPVVGVVVIAGGALRRHRIRRELVATGAGLGMAARGSLTADAVGPVAADRIPRSDDGSTLRSATGRAADATLVAREAAEFRLVRQTTLFVGYSAVAAVGILTGVTAILGGDDLAFFSLSAFAFLGVTIVGVAPGWALRRGVVVGEEHALLTRTGSWRLIRAHRILALVVGGAATALAALAAITLPVGGPGALWPF
ncbi:hypothetical protein ACFJGV_08535 [Cnuibacter sp. UC19_7]|uniref:hypothetical protein n=1 Tax=Cnuibacter sp. UC19_7 TaxID=3350166 RepID=UPI00366D00C1